MFEKDYKKEYINNWKECELEKAIELVIDYRGKTPKKLGGDWSNSGYRALSAKNIKTGSIVQPETIRFVDENLYKKWMKDEIKRGDILITSEAPFGQVYYWNSDEKIVLSQRIFGLRINNLFNSEYLYHYMTTNNFQAELDSRATGTTVVGLRQPELLKCKIKYPTDIETQQKIAKVLSAIDDKIELNNSMNNNLEQQAQAIFKSWFVNFEPFGGTMPEDWKKGTFAEIIDDIIGGDWGKGALFGNNTEKVYCIRGADIPEVRIGNKGKMPYRYILPKNYQSKKLTSGDLVVEISGGSPTQSTGRIAAITEFLLNRYDEGMICTNFCKAIKPKENYNMFIYYYWLYLYQKNVFFSYENGTTGIKNLDLNGFIETEPIIIPDIDTVHNFSEMCNNFEKIVFSNGYENEQLATLRNTLLPKLMSGEIDVSKIEINDIIKKLI